MLSALLLVVVVIGAAREVSLSGLRSRKQPAQSTEILHANDESPH